MTPEVYAPGGLWYSTLTVKLGWQANYVSIMGAKFLGYTYLGLNWLDGRWLKITRR